VVFVFLRVADPEGFQKTAPPRRGYDNGAAVLHPLDPAEIKATFGQCGS
jgi:hypothetical protein